MSRWIGDDPYPEYSRLDRMDGLGKHSPSWSNYPVHSRVDTVYADTETRTYKPRRRRKFFAFILECLGILAIMTTTLIAFYAAYVWL